MCVASCFAAAAVITEMVTQLAHKNTLAGATEKVFRDHACALGKKLGLRALAWAAVWRASWEMRPTEDACALSRETQLLSVVDPLG